jgi:hypothetical protein
MEPGKARAAVFQAMSRMAGSESWSRSRRKEFSTWSVTGFQRVKK